MPREQVQQAIAAPNTVSGQTAGSGADTSPDVDPPEQLPPALESFPYAQLLAYHRRQLEDPILCEKIEAELNTSPRWRAHLNSVRFLDLERAAAIQDGADLREFNVDSAGQLCLYAAVSDGEVFARVARAPDCIRQETRQQWAEHTKECVFCRRMRRLAAARVESEKAQLPKEEPLLREWLLGHYYLEALRALKTKIVVLLLIKRLPPALENLVLRHKGKKETLEELAREQGSSVETLKTRLDEASNMMDRIRADISREIEQLSKPSSRS